VSGAEQDEGGGQERVSAFMGRSKYPRRRLIDAIRFLPLLGLGLWFLPLLWNARADETPMSHAILYVFGVWLMLVVAAGFLAVLVARLNSDTDDPVQENGLTKRL